MAQFVHRKTVVKVFVYSENLKHYEKRFQQKILLFRSSRSQMFIKNFPSESLKTHEKTSVPESLFDPVAGFKPSNMSRHYNKDIKMT